MIQDLFSVVKSRVLPDQNKKTEQISVPENLMFKCPRCKKVEFMENFILTGKVCPHCNYHSRLTALERLEMTADPGSFVETDAGMKSKNPINFPAYKKSLERWKNLSGLEEAVVTGSCTIEGEPCMLGIMDSHFMMASMGSVVGEKITRTFETALKNQLPVILFCASGGARMQEGVVSLMQMAKTSGAVGRHSEAGGLYISVLTDPTTGGVAASFSTLGDIIIAEPKVVIGFAGRRVIEGTIRQRLPEDFQSAEFMLEHGFVDLIADRSSMRKTLGRLLRLHRDSGVGR